MQAPDSQSRYHEFVGGARCGRERRGVEPGERTLGLVEAADQQQAPGFEVQRMRGVDAVAMRLERCSRGVESLGGPGEITRDERDFGFGDDAARAGYRLPWTEGAGSALQKRLGPGEIAELRHRDAP